MLRNKIGLPGKRSEDSETKKYTSLHCPHNPKKYTGVTSRYINWVSIYFTSKKAIKIGIKKGSFW